MKNHRRFSLTAILLISLFVNLVVARQPAAGADPIEQAASRLAGSILVNGHSMDYLRGLTDQFGGRLTGTPAYQRAAEWAAEQSGQRVSRTSSLNRGRSLMGGIEARRADE